MSSVFKNQSFSGRVVSHNLAAQGLPRSIECVLALAGLIFLFPVLLVCALMVYLSSPGGVFFRQKRVGRGGQSFNLYKFRTMFVARDGLLVTAATDCRITKIGRFLRQWKLDELPELYNVLIGEMSFVGPRPEVPELVDFSNPAWATVLKVRPGITDPVTLQLRNEEAVLATVEDKESFYREVIQPYKLNGYMEYLNTKSLKNDLKVVFQTFKVVVLPKTAPPLRLEETRPSYIK